MPGYTYFFVDSVPKQCICPICKLPMQAPVVLTSCQHVFCDSCLRPRHRRGHSHNRASLDLDSSLMCPLDEQRVDSRNVKSSVELSNQIENCMVRCPQEPQGCRWVDIVRNVPSHLETCRYVAVLCPRTAGTWCAERFSRNTSIMPAQGGDACKHEGTCPDEQVWCENKCGLRIPRRKLARHAEHDCVKREVGCSFCRKRFLFDTLQSTLDKPDSGGVNPQFNSQRRQQPEASAEAPPPVPRRAASAECLDGGRVRGAPPIDCPLKWCGCQFKGDRASVDRHQCDPAASAHHVTLLAELARAQRRELDSLKRQLRHLPLVHSGRLVWRVDNYAEKLADSTPNRELEFCSVPFYTGRPGYRLQASAFLNGNGSGAGRYLSLYVKLLPGEFDPILDWPFVRPIRMRLLDQRDGSAGSRRHLEESFTPDPSWRHFKRPGRDASAAFGFGFPKFAAHELLRPEGGSDECCYLRDNVIFLEIEVLPDAAE
uniref:TNF receptor-associated factor n=1 Tax=Macrostomum lignano TaxID=282301 RepID=A0A1I8G477_9PLAT